MSFNRPQVPAVLAASQPPEGSTTSSQLYPFLPSSLTSTPNLQTYPSVNVRTPAQAAPVLETLPQVSHTQADRLAVPSHGTGNSRSRSNSRSSRVSSRRNTLLTTTQAHEDQAAMNKVRVVGIEDPTKAKTIVSQASTIEHLRAKATKLLSVEEKAQHIEQKMAVAEKKAVDAEERMTAAEWKAHASQKCASEAEKQAEEAKTRMANLEKALEAEKVWADERVKVAERNVQQEMEKRLFEAKQQALGREVGDTNFCEPNVTAQRGNLGTHDQNSSERLKISKALPKLSSSNSAMRLSPDINTPPKLAFPREDNEGETSYLVAQTYKGKSRQVELHPSNESPNLRSQVPAPMNFTRPRAGGKRLRMIPAVPPRLKSDSSDVEDIAHSDSRQWKTSFTDMGLHEKLEVVLDNHKKMTEILDALCAKGFPNADNRPRRRIDPDFKMPSSRLPRNPQRTATLRFVRCHVYDLMGISRAEDVLNYKDKIYPHDSPLRLAMTAYEEQGAGVGPSLKPTMHVNWDKFDGKWNSRLCSQFVTYLVNEEGYADGQPTDEEEQIVINTFWEQLDRLREIVKRNKPKASETEEQTSVRIAERKKEERAKASMNSRRKNTFHERIDTCLLHIESEGLLDSEKRAWHHHFAAIKELGVEGMSSDEHDDDDPSTFNVRTLPWRAQALTKICVQTDLARNTTNVYRNRRAGNLPRTRKRKEIARVSSRKAPAGKPRNFYNPQWYQQLGSIRQKKLCPKAAMEIMDTDFDM